MRQLLIFGWLNLCIIATAQPPFGLDTTFRTDIETWLVYSILEQEDSKVIISGQIKFPGDIYMRSGARLNIDGSKDDSYPYWAYMGGKLIPWEGKIYAGNGGIVRRLLPDGTMDPEFIFAMTNDPLFTPLQGGDFHVFPDGRIVMSGLHHLYDTEGTHLGLHNFIWFTNTGHVDTTRIHRKGNGAIYRFKELPDGKFIVSGGGNQFEGHPVDRIFRLHADGSLDTTFTTGVYSGNAEDFYGLEDGRVYAAGRFRITGISDTLKLVRFMPDGSLDPAFTIPAFDLGSLPSVGGHGAIVLGVQPWDDEHVVVLGKYQHVNGQPRRGMCILNSSGELTWAFHDSGVSSFTYQDITYASVRGMVPALDGEHYYIYGTYYGYSDPYTNDPLQRFVTRLHAGDFSVEVMETPQEDRLWLYPNPATERVVVEYDLQGAERGEVLVRDPLGRTVHAMRVQEQKGQFVLAMQAFSSGIYMLELRSGGRSIQVEKLIVQ